MRDPGHRVKLLFLLSCCIILAALVFRRPDAFSNPQFHAEEGKYFFADAYHEGFPSVFNTLNGYYHVLPRAIMVVIEDLAIPYAYLPAVYSWAVLLIYLLMLLMLWQKLPFSDAGKFFAGLTMFLLPLGHEILLNMTNIQWFTALVIFLVFFGKSSTGMAGRIYVTGLLFFAAFTGPFSLIMVPFVTIKLFLEWRKQSLQPWQLFNFLVLLAGASFTAYGLYSFGTVSRTDDLTVAGEFGALRYIFYQFSFPLLIGWIHNSPVWLFFTGSILCTTLFILFFYRTILKREYFTAWLCAFSLLFMTITLISYKDDPGALSPQYVAIRNFFLPSVFLCWALISRFHDSKQFVASSGLISVWFFLQTMFFIGSSSFVRMDWKTHTYWINKSDTVVIPINPPGWFIELDYRKMRNNKENGSEDSGQLKE